MSTVDKFQHTVQRMVFTGIAVMRLNADNPVVTGCGGDTYLAAGLVFFVNLSLRDTLHFRGVAAVQLVRIMLPLIE